MLPFRAQLAPLDLRRLPGRRLKMPSLLLLILLLLLLLLLLATPPPYQPPGASTHRHRHHQRKLYLQKMQGLRPPCL